MSLVICLVFCLLFANGDSTKSNSNYDEAAGKAFLKKINAEIQEKTTESILASWAYESNITDENLKYQLDTSAKFANFMKEVWKETIKYPWTTYKDPDVRRQFKKYSVLGTAVLPPEKYSRYNEIVSEMQSIYSKAKVCDYRNRTYCELHLDPEITEILAKCRDPDELRYYWQEWRNVAGKPVRELYKEYVSLSNEIAVLNNFTNNVEFWLKDFEDADFKDQMEELWQQLRPLYLQLHAYVRRRLREKYGEEHVTKRGPIPAHLLGNMWSQSWGNIFDFSAPYPDKSNLDVTSHMVKQGYTPLRMFKLAEEFFTSLNLSPMPDTFWKNSILERPNDGRDLVCHASAWDFYDGKDFRIKQCTRVTFRQLIVAHHEMGHVQYYLQYKDQPRIYKRGANPGFHEAVGDVMGLSVSTPKHLKKIGLLEDFQEDAEFETNQLFSMALDKIAFIPFGYLMDLWRWSVFEGKTTENDYNCNWWRLREKYQGLSPSVVRSEDDFDPGAKYHTVGGVPYIRYFVSYVIQFQFHRSLCIAANEYDPKNPESKPLHKCDIYQSKKAGALLQKMLQMGSSKPWPDAMEVITGQRKMDAQPMLEYFSILQSWLEKENKRTGEFIGWESSTYACTLNEKKEEAAQPSDKEGNAEDRNIDYSYAELVPQDNNYFGSPDYLEEVEPFYHRPKDYNAPANSRESSRKKKDLPEVTESYFQGNNPILDISQFKQDKSELKDRLRKAKIYGKSSCRGHSTNEGSDPPNYDILPGQDEEKTRILTQILKDLHQVRTNKKPQKRDFLNKVVFLRDVFKRSTNAEKKKEDASVVAIENEKEFERSKRRARGVGDAGYVLEKTNTHKNTNPNNNNSPEIAPELVRKSQIAMKEAQKMLSSFNFSSKTALGASKQEPSDGSKKLRSPQPETRDLNKVESSRRKKSSKLKRLKDAYQFENHFQSNKKGSSINGKCMGNTKTESNNCNECAEKKEGKVEQGDKVISYVVMVGKLPDINCRQPPEKKKCRTKKAYKQYQYNFTSPVLYNAVLISAGKKDKTDDAKDRLPKYSSLREGASEAVVKIKPRRNSRKQKFVRKRLSDNVKKKNINIKNIVQYFGLSTNFIFNYYYSTT